MNRATLALKRPFIWLLRFRHRCGYGVHSPFAFNLITQVIYEKTPYYKYKELAEERKRRESKKDRLRANESEKVERLLFRLVNYAQPDTLVDAGTLSASSLYLKAGREAADYIPVSSASELCRVKDIAVDFLYLHHYRQAEFVDEAFDICATRATRKSLFVIEGIRYTSQMYALWKRMKQDERVGITFDLYDLGIIFFDKTKVKQNYIVNF